MTWAMWAMIVFAASGYTAGGVATIGGFKDAHECAGASALAILAKNDAPNNHVSITGAVCVPEPQDMRAPK